MPAGRAAAARVCGGAGGAVLIVWEECGSSACSLCFRAVLSLRLICGRKRAEREKLAHNKGKNGRARVCRPPRSPLRALLSPAMGSVGEALPDTNTKRFVLSPVREGGVSRRLANWRRCVFCFFSRRALRSPCLPCASKACGLLAVAHGRRAWRVGAKLRGRETLTPQPSPKTGHRAPAGAARRQASDGGGEMQKGERHGQGRMDRQSRRVPCDSHPLFSPPPTLFSSSMAAPNSSAQSCTQGSPSLARDPRLPCSRGRGRPCTWGRLMEHPFQPPPLSSTLRTRRPPPPT